MAKLLFQGHGSFRLTSNAGQVVYVDPFAGEGYDTPADLILVTHQHEDHSCTDLCAKKSGCCIISNFEALEGGKHNTFDVDSIGIQAVAAYNQNHDASQCVGYIITIDGVKIYASGDTSKTDQMADFAGMGLDYALLCGDGIYNMDMTEAAECAKIIGAKHNIIIHLTPDPLLHAEKAMAWDGPNRLFVAAGQEIEL
ncbi:MAG: MBL fold metallo-hydrolase [Defluviitaleaceae bacterium]|nr:MBL fold metallo-hydrolase [Defluviitaleaceae bacterium]